MFTQKELDILHTAIAKGTLALNGEQARLVGRLLDKIEELQKDAVPEEPPHLEAVD